jgi:septum formation protein
MMYNILVMKKIILASNSAQRKILMQGLNIEFEIIPSLFDEKTIQADDHKERARLIALAKAQEVSKQYPHAIVISGDTFTFTNNKAFEKPETLEQAKQMLGEQSGQESICYTGCAYLDPENNLEFSTTAKTQFKFRVLSSQEIDQYVANNPVLTWSAGFCPAYPEGINMIESIQGSLSGFSHGLPMEIIIPLLEKSGVFDAKA